MGTFVHTHRFSLSNNVSKSGINTRLQLKQKQNKSWDCMICTFSRSCCCWLRQQGLLCFRKLIVPNISWSSGFLTFWVREEVQSWHVLICFDPYDFIDNWFAPQIQTRTELNFTVSWNKTSVQCSSRWASWWSRFFQVHLPGAVVVVTPINAFLKYTFLLQNRRVK